MECLTIVVILVALYFLFGQKEGLKGRVVSKRLQNAIAKRKRACKKCKTARQVVRDMRKEGMEPTAVGRNVSSSYVPATQPTAAKARALSNLLDSGITMRPARGRNATTLLAAQSNAVQLEGRNLIY